MNLGTLQQVPLREIWKHEEYDFSSWLSLPENLALLSETIGIEIIEPQTERVVGSFSADIIAEEDGTGRKILIENQLEASNHDHLGKLFTYGSGLDSEIIIWIVKTARQEHEQAINWLNEHTDEKINIFLIEIEAWRIGDSAPAPRFNVIAKPNDWAKLVKQAGERTLSDYKLLQQKFWEHLNDLDDKATLGNRKARPRHWHDVSIGSSKAHLSLTINKTNETITCDLYIPHDDDKKIFDRLRAQQADIEAAIGLPLEWMRLEGKRATRIRTSIPGSIEGTTDWDEQALWLINTAAVFRKVFSRRIK
ncbi:hypothetical protein BGO17_04430 [Candidatus Saccharibacteria bacterium 49-20]|nr:MAG: hypothetical protein BGO17_04430 [Candidatus Saccharibacteria bacterium 49-20]